MNTPPPNSALVTGASGFIGGRLVRSLLEGNTAVTCLVRAASHVDHLRSAGARLVIGDVTDRKSVARALAQSRADTVFHLAGLVNASGSEVFMRTNAGGVEAVAAACAGRASPPVLVVVSSLAAAGPSTPDRVLVEGDTPAPVSSYGRSKLAGEHAAAEYAAAVPITIVRPPIVFGAGDRGVFQIFRPIARWGLHPVPCGGEQCYSLVHIDDLVPGLALAARKGERLCGGAPPGLGIYYVASGERLTYVQLGQAIATSLGNRPPRIIRMPGPLTKLIGIGGDVAAWARQHPGWVNSDKIADALAGSWVCSPAKACTQLGWSPTATLADRLHATAKWYRDARWIWPGKRSNASTPSTPRLRSGRT